MKPKETARLVTVQDMFKAFAETGMFDFTSGDQVERIVIDLDPNKKVPVIHVRCRGDQRLLDVAETLDGVVIKDGSHDA